MNAEEEIDAFLDRFFKNVPLDSEDPTLCILKGHLISEELLHEILTSLLPHPEHLKNGRFTYAQTLALSRAVSDDERHDKWVWLGLKKLNDIRNQYGHRLTPEDVTERQLDFIEYVEKHSGKGVKLGCTRLSSAVLHLVTGVLVIHLLMKQGK